MSTISVTVNGQSGPNLTATSGDQIGVVVGSPPAPIALTVTTAGAPGGQGIQGPPGSVNLSDDTPTALGTAAAGTSADASRSDHVHALPTAAQLGLSAVATSGSYADLTGTPAAYTLPVASSGTLGGIKVGSGLKISSGVLSTTGGGGSGVSLSDATPQPLGTAASGTSLLASRADHVHALQVISTSDVVGLDALIASVAGGDVDGGDYVGVIPDPTITITSQPANYTASLALGSAWSSTGTGNTYWRGIAYNGSRWVIAGQWFSSGSAYYTTVSTDATTWTLRGNSGSPQFPVAALATDGTAFLAVGNGQYATSADGLAWSGGSLPVNATAVAYGGSTWLAVGTSSSVSGDGTTWASAVTAPAGIVSLCYGAAGGFVGLASGTSSSVYRTTDGSSWSTHSLPASATWSGVAFGGGVYVAVRTGSTAAYSSDGQTWSTATMPSSRQWAAVTYAGGRFLAFGYNSTAAAYSADGQTWAAITLPASGRWLAAAGGSSSVMAMNQGTGSHIYSAASSSAAFTVAAVSTGTLSYQWQASTDSGSTWTNVSGATASTLSLSGLSSGDSGTQYRCVVSATGTASVTSAAATLTVT